MGWEDTIYDTKAVLERSEPSEVRDELASMLEGAYSDYNEDWKDKWLGVRMYQFVMDAPFEDYHEGVSDLQSTVEDVATELFDAIEVGEGWNASQEQSDMASWFADNEVAVLDAMRDGEIPEVRSYSFKPSKHRTWEAVAVDAEFTTEPQGYINEDVFRDRHGRRYVG